MALSQKGFHFCSNLQSKVQNHYPEHNSDLSQIEKLSEKNVWNDSANLIRLDISMVHKILHTEKEDGK